MHQNLHPPERNYPTYTMVTYERHKYEIKNIYFNVL